MRVVAEVVAAVAAPLAVLEVVTANGPNSSIVPIAVQQPRAVGEEVRMGDAIVLQDNSLLHLFEKPGDGAADSEAAALVRISVEPLDMAGPVDLALNHGAGGSHLFGFAGTGGVGAIASHEQARGPHWADSIDHLAQGVGAAPGD